MYISTQSGKLEAHRHNYIKDSVMMLCGNAHIVVIDADESMVITNMLDNLTVIEEYVLESEPICMKIINEPEQVTIVTWNIFNNNKTQTVLNATGRMELVNILRHVRLEGREEEEYEDN